MSFSYDATEIKEGGSNRKAPDGVWVLRVESPEEGLTKQTKQNRVNMKLFVDSGPHKGAWFYHTVTFKNPDEKGAGFAKKFLKAIGLPYEGKIVVNGSSWAGKKFIGGVKATTNAKGYADNELTPWEVWGLNDEEAPEVGPTFAEAKSVPKAFTPAPVDDSEVPF
jgi:hypothetical protein